jgi:hypothetical protein
MSKEMNHDNQSNILHDIDRVLGLRKKPETTQYTKLYFYSQH